MCRAFQRGVGPAREGERCRAFQRGVWPAREVWGLPERERMTVQVTFSLLGPGMPQVTLYCIIMESLHCPTVYIAHSILLIPHYILQNTNCTLHIPHYILSTTHFRLHTTH